ncbi:MAG: hypothetical protein R3Y62_05320 [Eubacteriales bacterium]
MVQNIQEASAFYGEYYRNIVEAADWVYTYLGQLSKNNPQLIAHVYHRIKSAESMTAKLHLRELEVTPHNAVSEMTDAVGFRIICGFLDDVYLLVKAITEETSWWSVRMEKDYIRNVKPNGYRSYHIILDVATAGGIIIPVELQIRTIAQDAWASLEHQMKYKKEIKAKKLIERELKRCADEMASTDITMQTIRDLLEELE